MSVLTRSSRVATAGAVALALGVATSAFATDGDPDASFGGDGMAFVALGADAQTPFIAVGPDGSTVEAASVVEGGTVVARFTAAGVLDTTFGGTGVVTLAEPGVGAVHVAADGSVRVLVDQSGKPVPGASRIVGISAAGVVDPAVVDFSPPGQCAGREDAAFGPDGGLALLWELCAGGPAPLGAANSVITRRRADGSPDTQFGEVPLIGAGGELPVGADVGADGSGRVVVTGTTPQPATGSDVAVLRFGADGARDGAFGGAAVVPGAPDGLSIGASGRIAVGVGRGDTGHWRVLALTGGGTPDATFGTDGVADLADPRLGCGAPDELAVQADDKVLLESCAAGGDTSFPLARLTATGGLDTTFAGGGITMFSAGGARIGAERALLVGPGNAVLIGVVTQDPRARAVAPATGSGLGVFRAAGTPTPGPVTGTPPAVTPQLSSTQTTPSAAVQGAGVTVVKRCVSRRQFTIRLRSGAPNRGRTRIVSARVVLEGRRVAVTRADRLRAKVDLRNLPFGRFTVKVTMKLADGRVVRDDRRYRTCRVGASDRPAPTAKR